MSIYTKEFTSGIMNVGNSCYLSSILQCISYNKSLINYMSSSEFEDDLNNNHYTLFCNELRTLLIQLWVSKGSICPSKFKDICDKLMYIKGWGGHIANRQNDSHEFLEFILNGLHEGLLYEPKIDITINTDENNLSKIDNMALKACNSWKDYFKNGYSNIINLFYGQFLSEIKNNEQVNYNYQASQIAPGTNISSTDKGSRYLILPVYESMDSPPRSVKYQVRYISFKGE